MVSRERGSEAARWEPEFESRQTEVASRERAGPSPPDHVAGPRLPAVWLTVLRSNFRRARGSGPSAWPSERVDLVGQR